MLQLPTFIKHQPSAILAPSSVLHLSEWPSPHNDDAFLAKEEAELEEKLAEIRNANRNLPVLGRIDNDQEEYEGEPEDEEADNAEESEEDEFEQETG